MKNLQNIAKSLTKLAFSDVSTAELRKVMTPALQDWSAQKEDSNIKTLTNEEMALIEELVTLGQRLVEIAPKTNQLNLQLKNIITTIGNALQGK